jgi:N-acetylglucosamine-6-phosphate deacetylase
VIVLSGADLVLPDRILASGTLVIDDGRIIDIRADTAGALHNHYLVPGFIDVHVHGVDGVDVMNGAGAIEAVADRLPRYGVTAFCPTTVASGPAALRTALGQIRDLRQAAVGRRARVLPAHLESNFINPSYRGAQPAACLRSPRPAFPATRDRPTTDPPGPPDSGVPPGEDPDFTAAAILHEIERAAPDVGIVTLAPELDGGLDLIAWLTARGHRVSLGHSGATYEQARAAIAAGARQATHLFNRMPPFRHRDPGLVGAILQAEDIAAEVICDGFHVHPAVVHTAIAAKGPSRVLAITDGTAASGLPTGARAMLGGQRLTVGQSAAYLDDGTLAGSIATMDRVFQMLVGRVGLSMVDAATLCATTAARELGLIGHGMLVVDGVADLVILDAQLSVVQTYVGGELVYSRAQPGGLKSEV